MFYPEDDLFSKGFESKSSFFGQKLKKLGAILEFCGIFFKFLYRKRYEIRKESHG